MMACAVPNLQDNIDSMKRLFPKAHAFVLFESAWCGDCVRSSPVVDKMFWQEGNKGENSRQLLHVDVGTKEEFRSADFPLRGDNAFVNLRCIPCLAYIGPGAKFTEPVCLDKELEQSTEEEATTELLRTWMDKVCEEGTKVASVMDAEAAKKRSQRASRKGLVRGVNSFLLAVVFMIAGLAKLGALKAMEDMAVEMAYTFEKHFAEIFPFALLFGSSTDAPLDHVAFRMGLGAVEVLVSLMLFFQIKPKVACAAVVCIMAGAEFVTLAVRGRDELLSPPPCKLPEGEISPTECAAQHIQHALLAMMACYVYSSAPTSLASKRSGAMAELERAKKAKAKSS